MMNKTMIFAGSDFIGPHLGHRMTQQYLLQRTISTVGLSGNNLTSTRMTGVPNGAAQRLGEAQQHSPLI